MKGLETIKNKKEGVESEEKFNGWLAGIIDGDGNLDLRKNSTGWEIKAIRIKLHNRDIRILRRIQNNLHCGRIRSSMGNLEYSYYIVSTQKDMKLILERINGQIRLKVLSQ